MANPEPCFVCGVLVIPTEVRLDAEMESRIRAGEDVTGVETVSICDDCHERYEEWRKSQPGN